MATLKTNPSVPGSATPAPAPVWDLERCRTEAKALAPRLLELIRLNKGSARFAAAMVEATTQARELIALDPTGGRNLQSIGTIREPAKKATANRDAIPERNTTVGLPFVLGLANGDRQLNRNAASAKNVEFIPSAD